MHGFLWGATAATALFVAATLAPVMRAVLGFRFEESEASVPAAASIAHHNARVVAGIMVAAWAVRRWRALRVPLDVWVVLTLTSNAAFAGAAIGAYGLRTFSWLAHLPLEWAAVGVAASLYVARRNGDRRPARRLVVAVLLLVAVAAVVETWATPL